MTRIVEVKNVTFGYDEQIILKDISIHIDKGDYVGLIGPNGSAKSTFIKLLLGILKPLKGTIHVFGEEIKRFTQWERIGYVSQKATSFNKSFPATVEEIVSADLIKNNRNKKSKKENKKAIDDVLEIVKMQDYKKRLIGNLSGGQQQRVFIAKTLISQPELLLLDEPTVGIDMESQELFYDIMEQLNERFNMTILLVSHDIGVVAKKVNKLACIGNQKIYLHDCQSQEDMNLFIKSIYGKNTKMIHHHYYD